MSILVELTALWARIERCGPQAFLVTVTDAGTPHVTSAVVRREGDRLVVGAGRRTRANLGTHPTLTVLWPPADDPDYCLLVDGTFVGDIGDDGAIAIEPTGAVLHRVAGAAGEGPNCVPV